MLERSEASRYPAHEILRFAQDDKGGLEEDNGWTQEDMRGPVDMGGVLTALHSR